jgi:hypothetical protein
MAKDQNEKLISVAALHLDSENPRHDSIDNEPEIIAALYRKGVPKLAAHIADNGLSPLERLAVMRHERVKGRFVALEGNRRVCALKLLRDPSKAPNAAGRRLFEKLKAEAVALPEKIRVVTFDDRESADKWLAVKHEGPQDGIGTVDWDTDDKTRFNKRSGSKPNPNLQALELRDYAVAQGLVSKDEGEQISLTTLTRYLSNKLMREVLGLMNGTDRTIGVDQGEFDLVLQRFLRDSLPNPDPDQSSPVNSRTRVSEREGYARQLRTEGVAPTTRLDMPQVAAPIEEPIPQDKPPATRRNVRDQDKRPYVIPSDFKLTHPDPVLSRLVKELRRLKPDDFPFSCNYLSRAILERATILYANKKNITVGKYLHAVLEACTAKLVEEGSKESEVKALNIAAKQEHAATSIQSLGAGVHGSVVPLAGDLKKGWESKQKGLNLLIDGSQ